MRSFMTKGLEIQSNAVNNDIFNSNSVPIPKCGVIISALLECRVY